MATLFVRGDKPLTREQIEHNSRVTARMIRQECKEEAAKLGYAPYFMGTVRPSLRDMAQYANPPMKDKKHLLDGRTLREAWPELAMKIMALPDDPPEDLMQEQIQKDIELEAREERRIQNQKDQYPEYYFD